MRVCLLSCSVLSDSSGSSVHEVIPARIPAPGDLSYPGIEPASPESPTLQEDPLPLAPPEEPQDAFSLIQIVFFNSFCSFISQTSVQFSRSVVSDSMTP